MPVPGHDEQSLHQVSCEVLGAARINETIPDVAQIIHVTGNQALPLYQPVNDERCSGWKLPGTFEPCLLSVVTGNVLLATAPRLRSDM